MTRTLGLLGLLAVLATPVAAQSLDDLRERMVGLRGLSVSVEYRAWWDDMLRNHGTAPAVSFDELWWWVADRVPCTAGAVCHGFYISPSDIIMVSGSEFSECWVRHEMAHAILGRGDDAHNHRLFAVARRHISCAGQRA